MPPGDHATDGDDLNGEEQEQEQEQEGTQEEDGGYARVRYLHPEMLSVVGNPVLAAIGRQHGGKSAAQVAIRWTLQRGVMVMPCSSSKEHQLENLDVFDDGAFELSASEMAAIDSLDVPELAPLGLYGFGDPDDAVEADPPIVARTPPAPPSRQLEPEPAAASHDKDMGEEERRAAVMDLLGSRDLSTLGPMEISSQLQELGFSQAQVVDLLKRLHGAGPSLRDGSGVGPGGAVHPFLLVSSMANISWLAQAAPLYSPQEGAENMAPLLYNLVRFFKPVRVLEVGPGFASLFILQVRKQLCSPLFLLKMIILPTQARDKHRENSNERLFSRRRSQTTLPSFINTNGLQWISSMRRRRQTHSRTGGTFPHLHASFRMVRRRGVLRIGLRARGSSSR